MSLRSARVVFEFGRLHAVDRHDNVAALGVDRHEVPIVFFEKCLFLFDGRLVEPCPAIAFVDTARPASIPRFSRSLAGLAARYTDLLRPRMKHSRESALLASIVALGLVLRVSAMLGRGLIDDEGYALRPSGIFGELPAIGRSASPVSECGGRASMTRTSDRRASRDSASSNDLTAAFDAPYAAMPGRFRSAVFRARSGCFFWPRIFCQQSIRRSHAKRRNQVDSEIQKSGDCDGRTRFVVLGAGHMLGPQGIPSQLCERGLAVERIAGGG